MAEGRAPSVAAAALVDRAREQTGLTDLGPDGWQVGLDRLLAAAGTDLGHHGAAVADAEAMLVRRLVSRLRIEQWYAEHPDAGGHPVEGPVVIVGLPRTATTALQYLLAVDPQFRYQRRWEVSDPVPPPDLATEADDPRRLAARSRTDARHISTVDGPIEDVTVLGLHFHNQELGLPVPSYTAWWRDADLHSTFAYHERVLRLLHSRRPPYRWVLKAPAFLFHLPELADHYRDARFVMTHRDPTAALPSACSVVADAQHKALPDVVIDRATLGPWLLDYLADGISRTMQARERIGEDRFVDLGQGELETDALGTIARVYDFLGLRLTDDVRAAMTRWTVENPRGARGRHEYTAEEFGITVDGIREAFGDYIARFGAFAHETPFR